MKLVLDIGATNTRILKAATYEEENVEIFKTKDVHNLSKILKDRIKNVNKIVIAAAGPVHDGKVNLSKGNIQVNQKKIKSDLGIPTKIINDFQAQTRHFKQKYGNKTLIVGAGTGLGVGYVTKKGEIINSEAGHAEAVFTKNEKNLQEYFQKKYTRPEFNDIICGEGLTDLHHFLTGKKEKPQKVVYHKQTMNLFTKLLGRASKIYALTFIPQKLVLSGGVIIKNNDKINLEEFKTEFTNNQQEKLLRQINILLSEETHAGIKGALFY